MKYLLVLLLVAAASASNLKSTRKSFINLVEGIIDCGSAGTTLGVHIEGCTSLPCEFQANNVYEIQVDFIPKESHSGLHLRVEVLFEGELHELWNLQLENSAVEAGREYSLTYPFPVEGQMLGLLTLWNELYGSDNSLVEVCGLLTARISQ